MPFGNFIIQKPENQEVKEKTSFTGYDYMIKFNVLYKNRVTYPCKLSKLFIDVCEQVGLEVGNVDFTNCDYMILGNPFTNNEDCRTVLSNIAQLAGGFAKIGRDNKVYIKMLKNISNLLNVKYVNAMTVKELNLTLVKTLSGESDNADEKLNGNNYFDDFSKNEQWGELNSLVLGLSSIEGENTALDNKTSIEENGLTEITIQDNYFLTSQIEREKVIVPIWNTLKGIKYLPFKTNYYGYPYLDSGDMIYIQDTKDNGYVSYVFNHKFTFNGSFSGTLETPALTKTQTVYKNTFDLKTKFRNAERSIDKINGIIEDIIEETTENSQKLSEHEQTIDSITDKISSVETTLENDYYNKTETNAQIQAKADSITTSVTQQISTAKSEAIDNANESTDKKLEDYTVTSKLGTFIEQNWEYIKYAWNQISQYLKMEGIDGKATLNIYDENNNMLMSLSQDGQTFYDSSGNKIGTVGIVREENKDTLAFAMNVDWENVTESKSMAWGFFDKDGKFLPIFNLRSYYGQDTSEYGGELSVVGTLAVGEEVRVEQGGVLFGTEGTDSSLDGHNGNLIYTSNGEVIAYISKSMLSLGDYLTGYINELGGHTISCEYFNASNVPNTNNITMISASGGDYGSIFANINDGSYVCIYANNSDRNLKKNIKTTENKAIEKINKINHVEFDWKSNGEHQNIGYIAQEMNEIDSNFVHYSKYKDTNGEEKENWQINTLSVLATATKAIQEQQEEIKRLKEKDKQKDEIIANLIARIEKIERRE